MPREINVGYVIAMPKFTRTLKAVWRSRIRPSAAHIHNESVKLGKKIFMGYHYSIRFMYNVVSSLHTKKQACNSTEVSPGDVLRWANILHMCKVQDDRHKADKNKVGASNDAQEECSLSKFGTAQDHLEEHLKRRREQTYQESTWWMYRICPLRSSRVCRGRACQVPAMSLAQSCGCLFITLGSTDRRAEETRASQNIAIYLVTSLIRTSQPEAGKQTHTFHPLLSVEPHTS